MIEIALLAVAAATGFGAFLVASALRSRQRDARILELLATFGPPAERAQADPRVLLAWYPVASAARQAFPDAFAALEPDGEPRFPFSAADLEAAHARWSTGWLEWERHQDADHRAKREAVEAELRQATDAAAAPLQARLEALEREKLEQYQRRYEEYVWVSRALAELSEQESAVNPRRPSAPAPGGLRRATEDRGGGARHD